LVHDFVLYTYIEQPKLTVDHLTLINTYMYT